MPVGHTRRTFRDTRSGNHLHLVGGLRSLSLHEVLFLELF